MQFMRVEEAVELIRKEYAEMPGLQLTFWQAQRLWNLSEDLCVRALVALVHTGFLVHTREGRYVRAGTQNNSAGAIRSLLQAM